MINPSRFLAPGAGRTINPSKFLSSRGWEDDKPEQIPLLPGLGGR